jgi:hypothetical protein
MLSSVRIRGQDRKNNRIRKRNRSPNEAQSKGRTEMRNGAGGAIINPGLPIFS